MDPFAAIGFAANLLQFIDYLSYILKLGKQIRRNGMPEFNSNIQTSAKILEDQVSRLRLRPQVEDQALQDIADKCVKESQDLLDFMKKFECQEFEKKVKSKIEKAFKDGPVSLGSAIRIVWHKSEIKDLAKRIEGYRAQLHSEVLMSIRETVISMASQLDDMSISDTTRHQEIINAVGEGGSSLQGSLQIHSETLSNQVSSESEATRQTILGAIDGLTSAIDSSYLFPTLPRSVVEYDPSLQTAAIRGGARIEGQILELLNFRPRLHRQRTISETYKDTYSWIFRNPKHHKKSWHNFTEWLESGEGVYWIEGQAGCGKSTLMKYLSGHEKTLAALNQWANPRQQKMPSSLSDEVETDTSTSEPKGSLVTASYYFWQAGSSLEKDQEGLLRSLLYQILNKRRDFISRAFPELYESLLSKAYFTNQKKTIFMSCERPNCMESFVQAEELVRHMISRHQDSSSRWASGKDADLDTSGCLKLPELKEALLTIPKQLGTSLKVCLFVDGLDEYTGDAREIIELLRQIVDNTKSLKIVASSRPENLFLQAFGDCPRLRMQDLTQSDIEKYARGRLFEHPKLKKMRQRNRDEAGKLVEAVSTQASGVFLWVMVAVNNLLEGLTDGSTLAELTGIVYSYPSQLQPFYQHMFSRIKEQHRLEAFKIYLFISHARLVEGAAPSPLRLYSLQDDPLQSLDEPIRIIANEDLSDTIGDIADRVRSRCCGLVQVYSPSDYSNQEMMQDMPEEGEIRLLHRTVSDFLNDTHDMMDEVTRQNGFVVDHYLAASILWSFKVRSYFTLDTIQDWHDHLPTLKAFWNYCQSAKGEIGSGQTKYVNEMDQVLTKYWTDRKRQTRNPFKAASWLESFLKSQKDVARALDRDVAVEDPLLALAMRYGLEDFVEWRRSQLPEVSSTFSAREVTSCTNDNGNLSCVTITASQADTSIATPKQTQVSQPEKSLGSNGGHRKSKPCQRCQSLDKLLCMDYTADDAVAAINSNPKGAEMAVLMDWINRNRQTQPESSETGQKQTMGIGRIRIRSKPIQKIGWKTVSHKPPVASPGPSKVVGSRFAVSSPPKTTKNTSEGRRVQEQPTKGEGFETAGEIGLYGGKFTWFYEGEGPWTSRGLSETQKEKLREFVEGLLASQ